MVIQLKHLVMAAAVGLIVACASLPAPAPGEALVIARPGQVAPETVFAPDTNADGVSEAALVAVAELPSPVQEAIKIAFPEEPAELVLTQEQFLADGVDVRDVLQLQPTQLNEAGEPEVDWVTGLGQLLPGFGAAFPPAAPWLGIGGYLLTLLGRRRSRQHLATAAKSAVPLDGKIDLGGMFGGLGRAVGFSHSTEDPDELIALGEKKKAVEHAKNGGFADALASAKEAEEPKAAA